ncbi:flagellar motor switch protein FliG [Citreimonas salinaria]|uniref:Flagellar motor switch protein FliG n=2 Tax=Citreimonas salinaria TaxID=321339 RepID=A0A1H3G2A8_9RHOB|nr:flagellar motor switch protein FliG [Citreimonas salinaria]
MPAAPPTDGAARTMTRLPALTAAAAAASLPAPGVVRDASLLSRKAKAAIIVQVMLNEGADIPLSSLPDEHQTELTVLLGKMRYIDRVTLNAVIEEFVEELDGVGLSFPGHIGGALDALEGKISAQTAIRLRKEAGVRQIGDPWKRINALDVAKLVHLVSNESIQVAAVMMSKIDVARAAEVLAKLPGDRARQISYAVSMTTGVTPDAVDRIGLSIATQLDAEPPRAFKAMPDERLGEILNFSTSAARETLLGALEQDDAQFAERVRKAIFTFATIPNRIKPADVPKITRDVPADVLSTAFAAAESDEDRAAVDFIKANISKRMGATLQEDADALGKVGTKTGERAMTDVIAVIRQLIDSGEITLRRPDEEDAED